MTREKIKFTFGFIGTFNVWHGIEVLETIIPAIVRLDSSVHFLLIGDGILKEQLERACYETGVSGNVTFAGAVPQHKAPEYLALCDAFLCPTQQNADGSRFFGSPTKLFEYMSMAKPTIASDLEQLAEVIQPAVYVKSGEEKQITSITDEVGFLVNPRDIQGFIDACIACVDLSEDDCARMGVNARAKVLAQYTWQQHVRRIIDHARL